MNVSPKDVTLVAILSELAALCDRGFALAIHVRYTRPTLLYQTYDREWVDHYSEKGYMLSDPTVHWGLANVGAVDWSALKAHDAEGIIAAAEAHGITNGWTCATGPATSRSFGSMASSAPLSPEARARCCAILDEIHALTNDFDTLPAAMQERLRNLL